MELNSLIFPAPPPRYSLTDFGSELIWVPSESKNLSIPCLLLQPSDGSDKLMIYFHGNAEDLKNSYKFAHLFRKYLNITVLAVEYPGYGIYQSKPCEKSLKSDSEIIYDFTRTQLGYKAKDIFIFGRSIGSGPATHLARHRKIRCLLLMSPYTSIKAVVKDLALAFSLFVKQRFNNLENIKHITCPTFIVHGKKDKLIPYSHSKILQENCKGPCSLFIPADMQHGRFDCSSDLILPVAAFFMQSRIEICRAGPLEGLEEFSSPAPGQVMRSKGNSIGRLARRFSCR